MGRPFRCASGGLRFVDVSCCTHRLSVLLRLDVDGAAVCLAVTGCLTVRSQQVLPGIVDRSRSLCSSGSVVVIDLTGAGHIEGSALRAVHRAIREAPAGGRVEFRLPEVLPDHQAPRPRPVLGRSPVEGAFEQGRTAAAHAYLLQRCLAGAGIGLDQLWWQYFQLGGTAGKAEVDAYLHLCLDLPAHQRNLLAYAGNGLLGPAAPERAPYTTDLARTDPPTGPTTGRVTTSWSRR